MSSIVVAGDTSGSVTLQAPAVAGSTVLTLPSVSGNITTDVGVQTLTNKTLTSPTLTTPTIDSAQVPTVSGTAPLYMCRAWVNFNGTGTVAIRASGNVSSITDNGVGDYTVNFTTAMPDANYSMATNAILEGNTGAFASPFSAATYLAGSMKFTVRNQLASPTDLPGVFVQIFR